MSGKTTVSIYLEDEFYPCKPDIFAATYEGPIS